MDARAAPVAQAERIVALDAIRGFAVLGILVMNVHSFGMPLAAYMNPTALGPIEGADWWMWLAAHLFADRKFITIFSMLFGAGILLFTEHAEARGHSAAKLHYRRMFWLLLFGAAHAHLLWYGDILFSYAVCGMLAFLFRKCSPRTLLILGLAAMAVGSGLYLFFGWSMPYWPPEQIEALERENWRPPPDRIQWEMDAYRGGWSAQQQHRGPTAFFLEVQYLLMYELWRAGGLMLVGMALYRWGVLTAQRGTAFYARWLGFGLLAGLPIVTYGVYRDVQAGWSVRYSFFQGPQFNYWAAVLVSLAYVSLVTLAVTRRWIPWLTARLAAVGQMAFTNYIVHTLVCTSLFYGFGLGLYGRVNRLGQAGIVLAIWLLQLVYSPLWLRR
ncbi:MAG TPA: DUF418 domain-containing protein, partial [Terriglobia bacterium]